MRMNKTTRSDNMPNVEASGCLGVLAALILIILDKTLPWIAFGFAIYTIYQLLS